VIVPSWRPASCYQNLLTGEILSSTEAEGKQSYRLGVVMGSLPGCTAGVGDLSIGKHDPKVLILTLRTIRGSLIDLRVAGGGLCQRFHGDLP